MKAKRQPEPVLTNISPVKSEHEDLEIVNEESNQPSQEPPLDLSPKASKTASGLDTEDTEEEEQTRVDGIRFEMYSPEENEPVSRQQPGSNSKSKRRPSKDSATRRQEKMDEHDQNLVSSMRSYLVRKKLDFTSNVNGFFERLNETENQLKQ